MCGVWCVGCLYLPSRTRRPLGNLQEAITEWTSCLEVDPSNRPFNAKLYANRGTAYSKVGDGRHSQPIIAGARIRIWVGAIFWVPSEQTLERQILARVTFAPELGFIDSG